MSDKLNRQSRRKTRAVSTRVRAKDVAARYTFYVNPLNDKDKDPLLLQKRAYPYLQTWFENSTEDNPIFKFTILKAVLYYIERDPKLVEAQLQQSMIEQESARIVEQVVKRVVPEIVNQIQDWLDERLSQISFVNNNGYNRDDSLSLENENDEDTANFFDGFLDYDDEDDD